MKRIKLNEGHIARNASMNVETKFAKRWMEKGNAKPIREDDLSDYGVDPDELAAYGADIEANTIAYEKLQRNAELFAKSSGRDVGKLILSWSYECPEEFKDVWVDGNTLPIRNKLGTVIAKKVFLATDGLNEFSDTDIIADVVFDGIMKEDDDEVVHCMESVSSIGDAMKNCIEYVIEHMKDEYVPVDDESRSLGIYEKKEGATAKRFFNKHTDVKRVNESKETTLNESAAKKYVIYEDTPDYDGYLSPYGELVGYPEDAEVFDSVDEAKEELVGIIDNIEMWVDEGEDSSDYSIKICEYDPESEEVVGDEVELNGLDEIKAYYEGKSTDEYTIFESVPEYSGYLTEDGELSSEEDAVVLDNLDDVQGEVAGILDHIEMCIDEGDDPEDFEVIIYKNGKVFKELNGTNKIADFVNS